MQKQLLRQLAATAICLLLAIGIVACGGGDNKGNASPTPTATSTPTPTPTPNVSEDNTLKNKVEANLTKYGVTGVTVEVSGGEVTLKGDIPRAKLQDAMKAANEASPKKVNNQMNIK